MSDDQGVVIESNKGQSPFLFTPGQGEGQETVMIPALEQSLMGLHAGDQKDVKLRPEDAYGPVLKEAFKEVPKNQIPPEARKVGAVLQAGSTDGRSVPVRVSQVTDDKVVIDFNHPLAGKTLIFNVKIVAVKKAESTGGAPAVGSEPLPVEIPQ
jgi:FKBP-type peptidyl-prolyl cis-trans isomerase 2